MAAVDGDFVSSNTTFAFVENSIIETRTPEGRPLTASLTICLAASKPKSVILFELSRTKTMSAAESGQSAAAQDGGDDDNVAMSTLLDVSVLPSSRNSSNSLVFSFRSPPVISPKDYVTRITCVTSLGSISATVLNK